MFVKYATSDNAFGRLSSAVNTTQTTITLSSSQNLPTGTAVWIATLTQYANDGTVFKFEKVKVTNNVSGTLTVVRGFDGTTAETFNQDDYVFLNVVSEIIKDIQNAVDAMSSVFVGSGNNKVFGTDGSGNIVALTQGTAFNKAFGTTAGTVAEGNHTHSQYQLISQKNTANGYAGLDSNGQIDPGQLPVLATTETVIVADQTAMLALTSGQIQKGDVAVQSGGSNAGTRWLFGGGTISDINNWILLADTTPERSVIAGKPTTISGYGITDAVAIGGTQTITGLKTFTGGLIATDFNNRNVLYLQNSAGALKWHISHHTDFHVTESGIADYRLIVKAGGNVGIGVDPTTRLDINGGLKASGDIDLGSYNGSKTRVGGTSYDLGGAGGSEIAFQAGVWYNGGTFSPHMTVLRGGKLGFGVSAPSKKFHFGVGATQKDYDSGGAGNTLYFGTRYELSGIVHSNLGHILQWVWGDAASVPESSSYDGGWGMEFGAHGNPYLKMIAANVYIGRTDGTVYANGILKPNYFKHDYAIQYTNGNLNDLIEGGFYDGSNMTNAPDGNWWYIQHYRHSNTTVSSYMMQIATSLTTTSAIQYVRIKNNNTWTAWAKTTP